MAKLAVSLHFWAFDRFLAAAINKFIVQRLSCRARNNYGDRRAGYDDFEERRYIDPKCT